jgi:hypothetical protein
MFSMYTSSIIIIVLKTCLPWVFTLHAYRFKLVWNLGFSWNILIFSMPFFLKKLDNIA